MRTASVFRGLFATLILAVMHLTPAFADPLNALTPEEGAEFQNEFVPSKHGSWLTDPLRLRASDQADRVLNAGLDGLLKKLASSHPSIPQAAIQKAFQYYQDNLNIAGNRGFVTVIDFDRPSTEKRMHIIDMNAETVESLFSAHGEKSGDIYATLFSNIEDTHKSSLGIYVTGEEYQGKNGRSLYLHGMESTNSNAYQRAIVLHGAKYVSAEFIKAHGRLGLSWGCPAIEHSLVDQVVRDLENGSVIIAHSTRSRY